MIKLYDLNRTLVIGAFKNNLHKTLFYNKITYLTYQ